MATVVNDRDVLLLAASPRLLWTGVRGVTVIADTTSFKVNSGVPTPSSINLTANLNGVNGSVTWSVPFGTATLTPSGATAVLAYANMLSDVITVRASVTDGGVTWQGNITITKVSNGATGITGATGADGDKSRIAYTLIDGFTLSSSPSTSTVSGDSMPATGTWGETRVWTTSPSTASVGQAVFQSTGTYNPTTNQTIWVVPYLSNLKVGNLSAITAQTGTLEVGTTGHIRGGQTDYDTGSGFWLGYKSGTYRFSIGNSNNNLSYDGTSLELRANTGRIYLGTSTSDATMAINRFSGAYSSNAFFITDDSTGTGAAFAVSNNGFFAGQSMCLFQASIGESLRAITSDTTKYATVHQNLGATTAIALAGTTYSGYAGSGDGQMNITDGYLPFTGIHIAMIDKDSNWFVGDIVHSVEVLKKKDISNTLLRVETTTTANNKAVFGVINTESLYENYLDFDMQTWYNYQELYIGLNINSVGEGCINVCGINGDIEAGDLITSSDIAGKGMKQSDDIVRSYTVAKSTEDVKFDFPEQVKMIACTYMCG